MLSQDYGMQYVQKRVAWCEKQLESLECLIVQVIFFCQLPQAARPPRFVMYGRWMGRSAPKPRQE
jgi:hypothetical protein